MGPLAPNLKIAIFSQNITIWASMDLPGPLQPFLSDLDPGTKFFGPFSPKFKNLQFSHKTPQYGCLQTQLNPSIHIRGNLDPGAKFWVQGLIGPKLKIAIIPLNQTIWVSMDLPGYQQSYLR